MLGKETRRLIRDAGYHQGDRGPAREVEAPRSVPPTDGAWRYVIVWGEGSLGCDIDSGIQVPSTSATCPRPFSIVSLCRSLKRLHVLTCSSSCPVQGLLPQVGRPECHVSGERRWNIKSQCSWHASGMIDDSNSKSPKKFKHISKETISFVQRQTRVLRECMPKFIKLLIKLSLLQSRLRVNTIRTSQKLESPSSCFPKNASVFYRSQPVSLRVSDIHGALLNFIKPSLLQSGLCGL